MCRNSSDTKTVSYVKTRNANEMSTIIIKGSFSTKIGSITSKLMELIKEDPIVKVLIFSSVSFFPNVIFKSNTSLLKCFVSKLNNIFSGTKYWLYWEKL